MSASWPSIAISVNEPEPGPVGHREQGGAPDRVRELINQSLSANSLRAYRADLASFGRYGGSIPSSDDQIAAYIAALSEDHATATVQRHLATLSRAHDALGPSNPAKSALVRATMRGIRRTKGTSQRQAQPLLKEDLFAILAGMGSDQKDVRDRALLLIGFAGALRRSELVALNVEDIERVRQGIVVTVRRSKTDQEAQGRKIGIPYGRTRRCPVKALEELIGSNADAGGSLFRSLSSIGADRLSAEAVSLIVKTRVAGIGLDPRQYSGHSLRAGLATSAAMAGVASWKIRQQTGHSSDAMLARYIRPTELFENNAAGAVL